MKKHRKAALFAALVLIIGVGVFEIVKTSKVEKFVPDPTRQAMQRNLQSQWLLGKLCSPPCWAGITPGKTTANEAFELLSTLPEVTNVRRYEDDLRGEFDWDWVGVNNSGGRIFFDVSNPGQIVETILPDMTGYFDASVSLGEVIDVHGEPTHVRVKKFGPTDGIHGYEIPISYGVEFIWLSQGFAAESGLGEQDTQLNRNMPLYTLAFFTPSLEGYLNYQGNAGKTLQAWRGFDDVLSYLEQ
jgi:hypothetical protein